MSWRHDCEAQCIDPTEAGAIAQVIRARKQDLGGFIVRRVLPHRKQRSVGPWIFFDHFGPTVVPAGKGMQVRPHPHTGLATVTYLFEGAVMHRDSVGSVQRIEPGAINWMTAGRGIVHSERTPEDLEDVAHRSHGLQLWLALPREHEETEPAFFHHPAESLPRFERDGVRGRQMIGTGFGLSSPVATFTDTFYCALEMDAGASIEAPTEVEERAVYVVEGEVHIAGEAARPGDMVVLTPGAAATIAAQSSARVAILGGEPLDGPRLMYWNLVSSDRERLEKAKKDWKDDAFPKVPGELERIPLPDEAPHTERVAIPKGGELRVYQQGEQLGEITWHAKEPGVVRIVHTGVRESQRGTGRARKLVERLVRLARKEGWQVVPSCPYARKVITTTPELQDVLLEGWEARVKW